MNRSERVAAIIFWIVGIMGLFAIPAVVMPFSWMAAIHESLGMGSLPDAPIVRYLARSLSAFYAILSVILLFAAIDIRRRRDLARLLAAILTVTGMVLLGIDLSAGMPIAWTATEGPPTTAVGLLVLWLLRKGTTESPTEA